MQFEDTRMFRVKAVAEMFDVSVNTIHRAIASGQLEALKLGKGTVRIPAESLDVYLASLGMAPVVEEQRVEGEVV